MWIVNVALKRPYTFIVMAILILLATPFVLLTTPVDVLPEINIPVVSIIWTYTGLSAEDMANRITSVNERSLTTTVNDIEHIESQSLAGIAILKVFLQPNANIQTAIAQTVAVEQAQVKQMPPGATPPLVISYSASSIPVIQLGLSSPKLSEQALNDTALNFLRPQLVTIPGAAVPYPYGGKIAADLGRPGHARAARQRAHAIRRGQRVQRAKPDSADRHGEDRTEGIHDQHERLARHGGRAQRYSGAHAQRRDDLSARSRARARRLLAANQHRAAERPSRRADVGAEERQRVDALHRQYAARPAAERASRACRRT